MRARAPGKLVLSGAYAVLDGAPAIVAAVDRYAVADSAQPASFVTEEVRAALGARPAPWFDATPLRDGAQKLGLGSSAAILVASLAALELEGEPDLTDDELAARVFAPALAAHRQAQGGGSGVDVAASAYGGVLVAVRSGDTLALEPVALPDGVGIEVLSLGRAASTAELIARVRAFGVRDADGYAARMGAQALASERAVAALRSGDARAFVAALAAQTQALRELGEAAGVPIVTPELVELQSLAATHGAALLPAGAGGGDVALWVAADRSGKAPELRSITPVSLTLGARGVHRAGEGTNARAT